MSESEERTCEDCTHYEQDGRHTWMGWCLWYGEQVQGDDGEYTEGCSEFHER